MPGTVRLHRVFATSPEKLYRAFVEADAMAKWLPPNGFTCTVHTLEPRVGGTHRMSFRNFTTGNGHSFGGTYHELVPNERLRYTDKFDDANLPGEMTVTVTFRKVMVGTELNVVENQNKIIDDTRIQLQTTLSQVQDTDYTEAITRLQKEMLGLQAAQSSFAKTSDLNLFNYIR